MIPPEQALRSQSFSMVLAISIISLIAGGIGWYGAAGILGLHPMIALAIAFILVVIAGIIGTGMVTLLQPKNQ